MQTLDRSTRARQVARVAPAVAKVVSFLGCVLTLQTTPAAAETRRPVPPSRAARHAAPPWSEVREGSAPLTSARVSRLPFRLGDHPAIHPERGRSPEPQRLFPRLPEVQNQRRLRDEAMARHPAGKARTAPTVTTSPPAQPPGETSTGPLADAKLPQTWVAPTGEMLRRSSKTPPLSGNLHAYTVRSGDSLWSIAMRASRQADPRSIQLLTQRIYRINRSVVGPDPDLILPGQVLRLPGDIAR